jgi:2-polyprenyl-6-hydroxyphenyl methylase/3-demethylubiquinone-9 3-methyltransferase
MIRTLINTQIWLSRTFDKLLPEKYRIDGNQDFIHSFVPQYLKPNLKIYDIGGGKNPYLSLEKKTELRATIVGLDIDANELQHAPQGIYDEVVCADITHYQGHQDADLVICQALLEHVKDVKKAFASIASILKPGGIALIFVPSRNAWYARLNLIIPQGLKQKLLYTIYPHTKRLQGFKSYYDRCTPKDFYVLANEHSLLVQDERFYFISSYFSFFFPAYLLWRVWILGFHQLCGKQAAETFSMALKKSKK